MLSIKLTSVSILTKYLKLEKNPKEEDYDQPVDNLCLEGAKYRISRDIYKMT